jgi:hypothetical protein
LSAVVAALGEAAVVVAAAAAGVDTPVSSARADGDAPHKVRTSAVETAPDPIIESFFTERLS